jgi:hypothetical protein
MGGRQRAGRVDLSILVSALLGAAIGAAVVALLLPSREPATQAGMQSVPAAADPRLGELVAAVGRLEQKLAALELISRPRELPSERAPVPIPEGEADPLPLTKTEELHEDLRQLALRLDMLTAAWKEHDKPTFELPTLDQVHAARRDVDWVWLGQLAELYLKDEGAALEKARLMTFEQLLKRVGVPDGITRDNGMWMYFRPEHVEGKWRGVYFSFVGDCVSSVRTDK